MNIVLSILATLYITFGTVNAVYDGGVLNDDIAIVECNGVEYYVDGVDDYQVGDSIYALIDNNGTPNDFTDDEVIEIHYWGY